ALAQPPQVQGQSPPNGLNNRAGWIWQAPRGVVSTGIGPATASLLTGAYPQYSGVPSNDFYDPKVGHQRIGAGGIGDQGPETSQDTAGPVAAADGLPVTTLPEAVKGAGGKSAVFLGDP